MKALSIKQPWAWLIANGHKDIENRTWQTNYRGEFLIHAGKNFDLDGYDWLKEQQIVDELPRAYTYQRGGIVGIATIVDCVTAHDSKWFAGPYGFVLNETRPLQFDKCKGKLKFFNITVVDNLAEG